MIIPMGMTRNNGMIFISINLNLVNIDDQPWTFLLLNYLKDIPIQLSTDLPFSLRYFVFILAHFILSILILLAK